MIYIRGLRIESRTSSEEAVIKKCHKDIFGIVQPPSDAAYTELGEKLNIIIRAILLKEGPCPCLQDTPHILHTFLLPLVPLEESCELGEVGGHTEGLPGGSSFHTCSAASSF